MLRLPTCRRARCSPARWRIFLSPITTTTTTTVADPSNPLARRPSPFYSFSTTTAAAAGTSKANPSPPEQQQQQQQQQQQARFSPGEDEPQLAGETAALLAARWALDPERRVLRKTFRFPTFPRALDFIVVVGTEVKRVNHHPELWNCYKTVSYLWTTHKPRGLSAKDTHMARFCDDQARRLGHVDEAATREGDAALPPAS